MRTIGLEGLEANHISGSEEIDGGLLVQRVGRTFAHRRAPLRHHVVTVWLENNVLLVEDLTTNRDHEAYVAYLRRERMSARRILKEWARKYLREY